MTATIKANERKDLRRSNNRELRQNGFIPAVVYGKDKEPVTVSVNNLELIKTVREEGRNSVFSLEVQGNKPLDVMLYDYQSDSLKGEIIHVDFYLVDKSSVVDVEVSINLEGDSEGVRDGGVLQQTLHELHVRARPNEIPEVINVDISELKIGEGIVVGDLKGSKDYEILSDDETTIVTVLPPQNANTDEEGADEEEPAEPEVINEKSNDEEEE
ncbi:50S ribosomal protein L25/general stress protein Ctc [Virgibacillus sp. MSP4-1]|uniref:50S ribosomal protein L25/general stress protein Ctc n=1 Tax=Virgibacillus sp. MSP4-1 TaxID=2700081 RepID=UPI0003A83F68|nr:50S ribosomal protein L25/general stress protein Ctc [Virgibacillus sp. MSP4-1]QHS23887.1 50S ribosomal protein L25/general stress protein Ctc [Virgibacillus sp. MSP4-1]